MEINEISEQIIEFEHREQAEDGYRRKVALLISVLAMLLAIAALGGNKTGKELIATSIHASDTWNYYQAKGIRQTSTRLAADEVEARLAGDAALSGDARKALEERLQRYQDAIAHYESEADGSGRKELKAKAREFEHEREKLEHKEHYFALAEALLQISIVLASAAVSTGARFLVKLAAGGGVIGTLLTIDAYTLLIGLPF